MKLRVLDRIDALAPEEWNALSGADTPFTRHEFLSLLEASSCCTAITGWTPHHLVWEEDGEQVAAMPCYLKDHSYGEFVFDWSWADAMQRLGRNYYPKLVSAIPFSPVTGGRLLLAPGRKMEDLGARILDDLLAEVRRQGLSSVHLLFTDATLNSLLEGASLIHRQAVQFVWRNRGYADFEDFLANLKSSKRKQIRRERRKIDEQQVEVLRIPGPQITAAQLDFFLRCYQDTYLKRSGHHGYLNRVFFQGLVERMATQLMLVMAQRRGQPLACALFLFDRHQLYGRYWGAIEEVDSLHFELCYYQGIEFAIEQGLQLFNPGTQGEHKLVRGFEPTRSHSFHWLADPSFHQAVQRAVASEDDYINVYEEAARRYLPFRQG